MDKSSLHALVHWSASNQVIFSRVQTLPNGDAGATTSTTKGRKRRRKKAGEAVTRRGGIVGALTVYNMGNSDRKAVFRVVDEDILLLLRFRAAES